MAARLLDRYEPAAVVLVAGASPHMRPLQQQQPWETFSVNWQTDAVFPYFEPVTDVGRPAVEAYAASAGQSVDEYLRQQGSLVTPEIAATAVVELVRADAAAVAPGYRLSGEGLETLA